MLHTFILQKRLFKVGIDCLPKIPLFNCNSAFMLEFKCQYIYIQPINQRLHVHALILKTVFAIIFGTSNTGTCFANPIFPCIRLDPVIIKSYTTHQTSIKCTLDIFDLQTDLFSMTRFFFLPALGLLLITGLLTDHL